MTDILFIHSDGHTQKFPAHCSVAANLYVLLNSKKLRAVHVNDTKTVFKDGRAVAQVECSRDQVMESL